jgi:hypothetical protein
MSALDAERKRADVAEHSYRMERKLRAAIQTRLAKEKAARDKDAQRIAALMEELETANAAVQSYETRYHEGALLTRDEALAKVLASTAAYQDTL